MFGRRYFGGSYFGQNFFGESNMSLPSTPTNFTGSIHSTNVDLFWDNLGDATSYLIYRNTVNAFGSATLITTQAGDAGEYLDTATTAGRRYYWFLVARNASGDSLPAEFDAVSQGPLHSPSGGHGNMKHEPQISQLPHIFR